LRRSFVLLSRRPPSSPLFPYTTLFRSRRTEHRAQPRRCIDLRARRQADDDLVHAVAERKELLRVGDVEEHRGRVGLRAARVTDRSEEHTSELQSLTNLVCRLLLEKTKE